MKKLNVLNLIKYHIEKNDKSFKNESMIIAEYFDKNGDRELADYIYALLSEIETLTTQDHSYDLFESEFLEKVNINHLESLKLPEVIWNDLQGMINAISYNVKINKFLFEGRPGTGKTQACKQLARLLNKELYIVRTDKLIDSKLGQTGKNVSILFEEIDKIANFAKNNIIVLFDEIDVIALERINQNDVREMGRVTSIILNKLDSFSESNPDVIIIASTNLRENFDKALLRRFDAIINFDRYSNEDLIEIAESFLDEFSKQAKNISKEKKLFNKILNLSKDLPYPGDLKNIIKTAIFFSDKKNSYEYLQRIYTNLITDLKDINHIDLNKQGFSTRDIEKLTNISKSTIALKISRDRLYEKTK